MIRVFIPDNFLPERTYTVKTLLTHYLGATIEIIPHKETVHYELRWNERSIIIEDHFFGKIKEGTNYADPHYLPQRTVHTHTMGLDDIVMLYGAELLHAEPHRLQCGVDLFAGAFFMLTRWEESLGEYKDQHGRFPAARAQMVKDGFILRPIVDEYVALLRKWMITFGFPVPADTYAFKVVPTCDVDIPYFWKSKPVWKILGGRLRTHWNPLQSAKDINEYRHVRSGAVKDPYDTFDELMSLAEEKGLQFQFNFIGGGKTKYEGYYAIDAPHIKAMIGEIQRRGHGIGLHPSYDAFNNSVMISEEKNAVEASVGTHITSSRQHYLRFALPETWRRLHAAGIEEDSTLGYAAEPGFRCGTCKPYPVFDIQTREPLSLIERPLIIMDVSLRMYKNLSIDDSILLCENIKAQVKKHNGEFVILWHNSSLSRIDDWTGWERVLEALMGSIPDMLRPPFAPAP